MYYSLFILFFLLFIYFFQHADVHATVCWRIGSYAPDTSIDAHNCGKISTIRVTPETMVFVSVFVIVLYEGRTNNQKISDQRQKFFTMPGGSVNGRPFKESRDSFQKTGVPW